MTLAVDHVSIACADLDAAVRRFEIVHGLEVEDVVDHADSGLAVAVVPLELSQRLELLAVRDPEVAHPHRVGRQVAIYATEEGALLTWAVRTDDLDAVARRLRMVISDGTARAVLPPVGAHALPAFVDADAVQHASPRGRISHVAAAVDSDALAQWLGPHDLPVAAVAGRPGLAEVRITSTAGEQVVLR